MSLIRTCTVVLGLTLAAAGAAAAQNYVVIVNESVPADALRRAELVRIFQRQAIRWPNGSTVEPVDQAETAPIRERFTQDTFRRSTAQMKAYWQAQLFSGQSVPPLELATEQDVIAYVQSHGGAIAYVSAGARLPVGVRRLTILGR
jgi:ABC-type phosphate transport system substrate-binding protein